MDKMDTKLAWSHRAGYVLLLFLIGAIRCGNAMTSTLDCVDGASLQSRDASNFSVRCSAPNEMWLVAMPARGVAKQELTNLGLPEGPAGSLAERHGADRSVWAVRQVATQQEIERAEKEHHDTTDFEMSSTTPNFRIESVMMARGREFELLITREVSGGLILQALKSDK